MNAKFHWHYISVWSIGRMQAYHYTALGKTWKGMGWNGLEWIGMEWNSIKNIFFSSQTAPTKPDCPLGGRGQVWEVEVGGQGLGRGQGRGPGVKVGVMIGGHKVGFKFGVNVGVSVRWSRSGVQGQG